MGRLEDWMVRRLTRRLQGESLQSPCWVHAMSLLSSLGHRGDLKAELRTVYLRALQHPRAQVRISGVVGLRDQGITARERADFERAAADPDPSVRRLVYSGLAGVREPWAARLLVAALKDPSLESVVESAQSLSALGHRPAVPALIAFLAHRLRDPQGKGQPLPGAVRVAAEAAVKLARLEGYDFAVQVDVRGNRHMHATVIVNREEHYLKELQRLLRWWDRRGKTIR